ESFTGPSFGTMNTASKKTTTETTTIVKAASTCEGSSSQDEDETAAEDDSEARVNVQVKKERKTCSVRKMTSKSSKKESQQWRGIAIRLVQQGMDVIAHSLRRRSKLASGVEEDFDEKTQLLKNVKVHINKANDEGGHAIRDAAMATVDRAKVDDKPKFDIHEYLLVQQRQRALELEYQASSKKQRLELEARQLTLDEQTLILQQQQMQMMSTMTK
ncbi:unnamed protein product, partial [Aphanomyces euteiches]